MLTFYEVSGLSPARLPIPPQGHFKTSIQLSKNLLALTDRL